MKINYHKIDELVIAPSDTAEFRLYFSGTPMYCKTDESYQKVFKEFIGIIKWANHVIDFLCLDKKDEVQFDELMKWVDENLIGKHRYYYSLFLESDEDMVLFRLRWM